MLGFTSWSVVVPEVICNDIPQKTVKFRDSRQKPNLPVTITCRHRIQSKSEMRGELKATSFNCSECLLQSGTRLGQKLNCAMPQNTKSHISRIIISAYL
jgi:hypothetical protein